jgi:pimeloyl-ACP methyl ester carboxylesterase
VVKLAALVAALLLGAPARADDFVLVHGAWVGAWYWDPVVAGLQAAGHRVVAVDLRGQGDRRDEGGPEVSVADHVADIVAAIADNDLHDVILVAHSYGGRPATGAWDLMRDRIAHVVAVESVVPWTDDPVALPADGRSLAFLVTMSPDVADSGMLPPSPTLHETAGHPLSPMSLKALYGEVRLRNGPLPPTPGTFVLGSDSSVTGFVRLAEAVRALRGWDVVTLDAGHDVVGDAPAALTALLLEIADR